MKNPVLLLSVLGCLVLFTQCDPVAPEQADTLSVTPESVTIPSEGGSFNDIIVSTNTLWIAISDKQWLIIKTVVGVSGNNQAFSYELMPNTSSQSRTAEIKVIAGSKCQKVQVMQDGNPPIVDEFLSRWYPTNCGTQPYGDSYRWDQLPACPSGYHIPTKAEFNRLVTYPNVWGTGPGGVNGRWFCPTEAIKDNPSTDNGCVFFPAAGYRYFYNDGSEDTYNQDSEGDYWSSALDESYPDDAFSMYFNRNYVDVFWDFWRHTTNEGVTWWYEASVRCIKDA